MSLDRIIDVLNEKLAKNYVFPEVAEQIGAFLRQQLEGGHYDSINDMKKGFSPPQATPFQWQW